MFKSDIDRERTMLLIKESQQENRCNGRGDTFYPRSAMHLHDSCGDDYSNLDLSYVAFENCDFTGASFANSLLCFATFKNCKLNGVDFTGADLVGCNTMGSNFKDSKYQSAVNLKYMVGVK